MTMPALDMGHSQYQCGCAGGELFTRSADSGQSATSGKKCLIAFYRFMPGSRYLKQLIDDGCTSAPYMNMR
ncbi:MAG: hypothetical protein U0694_06575 [Anaerolineae bacterium]